jgi:hypothetical protein
MIVELHFEISFVEGISLIFVRKVLFSSIFIDVLFVTILGFEKSKVSLTWLRGILNKGIIIGNSNVKLSKVSLFCWIIFVFFIILLLGQFVSLSSSLDETLSWLLDLNLVKTLHEFGGLLLNLLFTVEVGKAWSSSWGWSWLVLLWLLGGLFLLGIGALAEVLLFELVFFIGFLMHNGLEKISDSLFFFLDFHVFFH